MLFLLVFIGEATVLNTHTHIYSIYIYKVVYKRYSVLSVEDFIRVFHRLLVALESKLQTVESRHSSLFGESH